VTNTIRHPPSATHALIVRTLAAASFALFASGCTSLGYYWQSVGGQIDVWRKERPVEEVIADAATPEKLQQQLKRVREVRDFASRELGLPDNASYRRYADLDRPFVVWNVFAAPEFSMQPVQWCFPFAGCVSYRGYFSKENADRFAAGIASEGQDVYVGGVPAYSTLGWFADPVLNTFIHYPDFELARLMFHELAHQVVYAPGDTAFNESFAVAVEQEGVRRWLAKAGDGVQREGYERANRARAGFIGLVEKYRQQLEALYKTRLAPAAMRDRKQAILAEMESEYRGQRKELGAGYDRWFAQSPNNAKIASVAIYTQLVPAFEALLARENGDLARFYAAVRALAALPKEERDASLRSLLP
jgi:predicted aminopeptidase